MRESLRSRLACSPLFICLSLGTAIAAEPVAADTTAAPADESSSHAALERGHQLLAEKRYDEAIKEFEAALEQRPTAEIHISLAMAMLRGRKVLQPGDMCDAASYRTELESHRRVDPMTFNGGRCWFYEPNPVESRQQEIAKAIEHFEAAAKIEPDNASIYQQVVSAKIALSQFEEEVDLRTERRDIEYTLGHNRNLELPSLSFFSNAMYPLEPEE